MARRRRCWTCTAVADNPSSTTVSVVVPAWNAGEDLDRCLADVFSAVLAHRGTLSGEHGIGLAKRDYVGLELSPEVMGLMRGIKTVFDPAGILNPGKGLPETT